MFLRGMWHPTQLPPAPFGSWCAWVASAAGAAYCAWQRTQTPLPAGVASRSRSARRSSPWGSWQVTQDIWRAQPPSRKSRPSPEVIELPPALVAAPLSPLPGERVTRKQHLVAAGTHPIDPFGARHLTVGPRHLGTRLQERAPRREVREHARIVDVLAAAAVAGLTADADLDEVARREPRAQLVNPVLERLVGAPAADRPARRSADGRHLGVDRVDERPVARDVEAKPAIGRQQLVHHLPLVPGRPAPGSGLVIERAPNIIEVGDGVVAEDAGLIPDAARVQPRPLRHQHRVALEAKALGLEDV